MNEAGSAAPRLSRRKVALSLFGLGGIGLLGKWGLTHLGDASTAPVSAEGRDFRNFEVIYGDPKLRERFRTFLENVFHLYPVDDFDRLIAESVRRDARDPFVYRELARRLDEVTPVLGAVRYSLPALAKQKAEMARQTVELLGTSARYDGYLEVGSHGRYLDALRDVLDVRGAVYTTAPRLPSHGPEDVVDRGRFALAGAALPWTDYAPLAERDIPTGCLDLVTVYVGLHHTTEEGRPGFVRSLHRVLSRDGRLVVRDHDVVDESLRHLVGLAHDVFNVGTGESFRTNETERRNFYSLDSLVALLEKEGFRAVPRRLVQAGDPTQNTLLAFSKV
jgi:hypothetical protein